VGATLPRRSSIRKQAETDRMNSGVRGHHASPMPLQIRSPTIERGVAESGRLHSPAPGCTVLGAEQ
jgi:hypothetical protein